MITKKFICICLFFLSLPFIVNFLSCFNAPFDSWSKPSEWTTFWGQYISGFAAFAMLYVAWKTLVTTKEANRPYIVLDIVDKGQSRVFIRCRNIGNSTAKNIKILMDENFIEDIKIGKVKESVEAINNTAPFVLEPNGEKVWEIFLIPGMQLDSLHRVWGKDSKYPFKGESISKSDWVLNEDLFKAKTLDCQVAYNDEYVDSFEIDYNNILDGITPDKRISDNIFSVVISLSHIESKLDKIKTAIDGTEQNK